METSSDKTIMIDNIIKHLNTVIAVYRQPRILQKARVMTEVTFS